MTPFSKVKLLCGYKVTTTHLSSADGAWTDLSGVCAGMDTQQTTVLIAVMIRGGVVHPMMPKTRPKRK